VAHELSGQSIQASGQSVLKPRVNEPPRASIDDGYVGAALAVRLVVASSTATKQAPSAICDPRTTFALRRLPTTVADSPGPGVALVRLAPTIGGRR
jgi:hypothetical protein